jgi:DNA-directed RNA polymerase specialized sigma24 family protein
MGIDDGLRSYVTARYPQLRRAAFLMCGDWVVADELTRATLAMVVAADRRGAVADPDRYAWAELMHPLIYRPGRREQLFLAAPDSPGTDPATVLLLDALHRLAPRCRAVLLLRHAGLAIEQVADALGLSDERVTAYEAAGLGALDTLLAGRTAPTVAR